MTNYYTRMAEKLMNSSSSKFEMNRGTLHAKCKDISSYLIFYMSRNMSVAVLEIT